MGKAIMIVIRYHLWNKNIHADWKIKADNSFSVTGMDNWRFWFDYERFTK
jgi:hypothetical protein